MFPNNRAPRHSNGSTWPTVAVLGLSSLKMTRMNSGFTFTVLSFGHFTVFFLKENHGTSPHVWMIFPAISLHLGHRIPAVNHPKLRTPTSTCLGFSYGEIMENWWIVVEKWWNIVINCDKDDGILMFFFFPVLKSKTYPVPVCFFRRSLHFVEILVSDSTAKIWHDDVGASTWHHEICCTFRLASGLIFWGMQWMQYQIPEESSSDDVSKWVWINTY